MRKYKLRDHFSIKTEKETFVGPCEVELELEDAVAHQHKLESFPEQEKHIPSDQSYSPEPVKASKSEEKSEESKPTKAKK